MKIIGTAKRVVGPFNQVDEVYSYVINNKERFSGVVMWPYAFDCKYQRVRYTKLYFDTESKKVLGKTNEVQPWEEVCGLELETRIL